MAELYGLLGVRDGTEFAWVMVGLGGQLLFSARFLVQWIASERARRSVVPVVFWYFSMAGGVVLLAYAIWRRDPVFILGQGLGVAIYARNLWLIHAEKADAAKPGDPGL